MIISITLKANRTAKRACNALRNKRAKEKRIQKRINFFLGVSEPKTEKTKRHEKIEFVGEQLQQELFHFNDRPSTINDATATNKTRT